MQSTGSNAAATTNTTGNSSTPTTGSTTTAVSGTSSRSSSSRRHRSRSHHGHHRHRSRRRRHNPKGAERNLVAAILGMIVIAVLISSLAEQKWFRLHGGLCTHTYIGAYQFLTPDIENSSGMITETTNLGKKDQIV